MSRLTPDELEKIENQLAYNSNNCGGCETCLRLFGASDPTWDDYTVYRLVQHIHSLQTELATK